MDLLSDQLFQEKRLEEALLCVDTAILFCLPVGEGAGSDYIRADALITRFNCLDALGCREDALVTIQESVNLLRVLTLHHPTKFHSTLARSLHSLSTSLSDLGQQEEALSAIQEAVTILRDLAQQDPTRSKIELATSLNGLSIRLSDLGQQEEALRAIQEAVTIE